MNRDEMLDKAADAYRKTTYPHTCRPVSRAAWEDLTDRERDFYRRHAAKVLNSVGAFPRPTTGNLEFARTVRDVAEFIESSPRPVDANRLHDSVPSARNRPRLAGALAYLTEGGFIAPIWPPDVAALPSFTSMYPYVDAIEV